MTFKTVDAKTLKKWLDTNEAVVFDVRNKDEHSHCHIKGARLMSIDKFNQKSLDEFKDKKIVLYCKLGKNSMQACERLLKPFPKLEIYSLTGGIEAWKNAGFGCEMDSSCQFKQGACENWQCLSFSKLCPDNQVRVIFGGIVLLLTLLGFYMSHVYFAIISFLAIAYIISGYTGICYIRSMLKSSQTCESSSCEVPASVAKDAKPTTTSKAAPKPESKSKKPPVSKTKTTAKPKKKVAKKSGKKA